MPCRCATAGQRLSGLLKPRVLNVNVASLHGSPHQYLLDVASRLSAYADWQNLMRAWLVWSWGAGLVVAVSRVG